MCDDLLEGHVYPTMFGDAEVFALQTEEGMPFRALYVGGGFQSAAAQVGFQEFTKTHVNLRGPFDLSVAQRPQWTTAHLLPSQVVIPCT